MKVPSVWFYKLICQRLLMCLLFLKRCWMGRKEYMVKMSVYKRTQFYCVFGQVMNVRWFSHHGVLSCICLYSLLHVQRKQHTGWKWQWTPILTFKCKKTFKNFILGTIQGLWCEVFRFCWRYAWKTDKYISTSISCPPWYNSLFA